LIKLFLGHEDNIQCTHSDLNVGKYFCICKIIICDLCLTTHTSCEVFSIRKIEDIDKIYVEKCKTFSEFSEIVERLIDDYQSEKKRVLKVINEVLEDKVDLIFKNFYDGCFQNINKVNQQANLQEKINFVSNRFDLVEILKNFHYRKNQIKELGDKIIKSLKKLIESNPIIEKENNLFKKPELDSFNPWGENFPTSTDITSKIEREDYHSKPTNTIGKIFCIGDYNNKSFFSDKSYDLGRTASNLEESDLSMSNLESQNLSLRTNRKILIKNSKRPLDKRASELEKVESTCENCNNPFKLFRKELDWLRTCSTCSKQNN
jgi:hypothetical protein